MCSGTYRLFKYSLLTLQMWPGVQHYRYFRSQINFILSSNVNVLLTTSQLGTLLLIIFVAGVVLGIELVFRLSSFLSLRVLRLRFGAGWVFGWHVGLDVVETCPYFGAASYDSTFFTQSLNVQQSRIWRTKMVSMYSDSWFRNFLCLISSKRHWFPSLYYVYGSVKIL